jgi:hypothetical protein
MAGIAKRRIGRMWFVDTFFNLLLTQQEGFPEMITEARSHFPILQIAQYPFWD